MCQAWGHGHRGAHTKPRSSCSVQAVNCTHVLRPQTYHLSASSPFPQGCHEARALLSAPFSLPTSNLSAHPGSCASGTLQNPPASPTLASATPVTASQGSHLTQGQSSNPPHTHKALQNMTHHLPTHISSSHRPPSLFLHHTRLRYTSGPLHWLCPLPETLPPELQPVAALSLHRPHLLTSLLPP